jgi:6-phosphofructokinase 1
MNALLVHSGGPTAVINASLAGAVEEARALNCFGSFFGARFGLGGALAGRLADLGALDGAQLEALAAAPSSALGTDRRELAGDDLPRLADVLAARAIGVLLLTGGNGTMGGAARIARFARETGLRLQVIGIPKTIDNDLMGTDHTPGYASAARFFASAVRDIGADSRAQRGQVQIVESLGRNAGWIVAAGSLARVRDDDPPHLVYLPERRLPLDRLLGDIDRVYSRLGYCVAAVCEGQLDEHGEAFGADVRAGSRGTLAMNLAHRLAALVTQHLGLRARGEKPGVLGRSCAALRSEIDWREARMCGCAAVRAAAEGATGMMVALERAPGPEYAASTCLVDLEAAAAGERLLPAEWIAPEGNAVLPAFAAYALPLTGPISGYAALDDMLPHWGEAGWNA